MKVALLSPVAWRTPPTHYGPWEQVVSNICEGLVSSGIDVTLFATGNSVTNAKLAWCCEKPYADNSDTDAKVNECLHISNLFENADSFDIIHNNYDFLPLAFSKLIKTPMVTTIHGFSSPLILPVYKKYNHFNHYVSISNSNRHPDLNYIATIYNGIDTGSFTFCEHPDKYLLYFGRIHPEKGTREAIEIAKKSNKKLIIAGLIQDKLYFDKDILPHINQKDIQYAGNANPLLRNKLLRYAAALLHPISFDEPFGLSVVEAMCCGTPVIAFNKGAMNELIHHNKTGFLVQNVDEAVNAVVKINTIDRQACRLGVIEKYSKERMTEDYIQVYKKILNISG